MQGIRAVKDTTDHFAADEAFMIDLRMSDLDEMPERLDAEGLAIVTNDEWDSPETRRFTRIHDPESSAIERWEPPA